MLTRLIYEVRNDLTRGFRHWALGPACAVLMLGLIVSAAIAEQPRDASYRLGPGDCLVLTVLGHPEFSGEFLVPADGRLNTVASGVVEVTGKTIAEVQDCVTARLKERLVQPEVGIALKTPRDQRVFVNGSVKEPGGFEFRPGWHVMEVLTAAGGFTEEVDPSRCTVAILRAATGERLKVDLPALLRGDPDANRSLEPGDVVTVDVGEQLPVYVTGKVKNPGLYRLRKDNAGVLAGLTMAGGALDDAATSTIKIVHVSGENEIVDLSAAILGGETASDVKLQAGDMIVVPENTARVAVLGMVREPGVYVLKEGRQLMLSDAIALAKGVENKRASLSSVTVIRNENGKQTRMTCNLKSFLGKGDATQNPPIKAGDVVYVPESGRLDWDAVMRSVASLGVFISPFAR